jgi:hypothetical protein
MSYEKTKTKLLLSTIKNIEQDILLKAESLGDYLLKGEGFESIADIYSDKLKTLCVTAYVLKKHLEEHIKEKEKS